LKALCNSGGLFPAIGALGVLMFSSLAWTTPSLSETESRGKRIYELGIGRREISVHLYGTRLGGNATEFPCIRCHGEDGSGGSEGGVFIADIKPSALSTPAGHKKSIGLRPAYTPVLLARAVRKGINPAGSKLHPLMPRYQIVDDDLRDLLTYLSRLGNQPIPGVNDTTIRIGTITPTIGPLSEIGHDVQKLLVVAFDQINRDGGIFGRRLELASWATADALVADIESNPPFCLIAGLGIDFQSISYRKLAGSGLTVIGPLAIAESSVADSARNVFFIQSSLSDQAKVLVDFAKDDSSLISGAAALLFTDDVYGRSAAEGVRAQARSRGLNLISDQMISAPFLLSKDVWKNLDGNNIDMVFFFGHAMFLRDFLAKKRFSSRKITLLGSADLGGYYAGIYDRSAIKAAYLSSSVVTLHSGEQYFPKFKATMEAAQLTPRHRAVLESAYAGGRILEATLVAIGRDISRRKLVQHLERTNQLITGVTPPITFNINRHTGHNKVTVFEVNPVNSDELVPVRILAEPK
jgi:ABC-type branched-subunit amino acid transport system substrate-binding protein